MKKILFIVIDGLGEKPIPQLNNQTPLEAATTPNLDYLAKNGVCGVVQPFKFSWQPYPTSDVAHLGLFGYDPKKYYLGRGVYEVSGIGMKLKEGDIALRVNFGTVDKNLKIFDRRAQRIEDTQPLVKSCQGIKIKGVEFILKKSYGHRAGLILRGKNLSPEITDGDPHKIGVKVRKIKPKRKSESAEFTANILNQFLEKTHKILEKHPLNKKRVKQGLLPANYLLVRGAGQLKKVPSFKQKYGLSAACIAGGALYKGIAKVLGMKIIRVPGATGKPNTNLKNKFFYAKKFLKQYDFIFLHIKATDNLAEDGNFLGKKMFIEKIDKKISTVSKLNNTLVIVTADHNTCSLLKRHCNGAVPLLIWGANKKDDVSHFSEKDCKNGMLKKIPALNLMKKIFDWQNF